MAKAPKEEERKSVATTKQASNLPAELMAGLAADAGRGGEEADRCDMQIPFLKAAQKLSPEVDEQNSAYIDGLRVGMLFNNASQRMYDGKTGLWYIPVKFVRKYNEWTPIDSGGGFQGEHPPSIMDKVTVGDRGQNMLPNGNQIIVAGTWFGLCVDMETQDVEQAVIALQNTQLKKSRGLMTKLKSVVEKHNGKAFNPPFFYNRVHVTTVYEDNDKGNWYGWKFALDGNIFDLNDGADLYDQAKIMLEGIDSGRIKSAKPEERDTSNGGTSVEGHAMRDGGQKEDRDIPF